MSLKALLILFAIVGTGSLVGYFYKKARKQKAERMDRIRRNGNGLPRMKNPPPPPPTKKSTNH